MKKTASPAAIQNLIFDFGGVLLPIEEEKTWQAFERLGAQESLGAQKKLFESFEKGALSEEEFLAGLQPHFFRKNIFKQELAEAWCAMCYHPIPEDTRRFLRRLRRQGYRLFLLSNTNTLHISRIRALSGPFDYRQFLKLFHGVYYSQEVGLRKPQKKIYERLLEEQELEASACFYVDDKKENLKPAQSLGMQVWHLNREAMGFSDLEKKVKALPSPVLDKAP
ncbi:MAG: HAD family phosphatase [Schleiferiaceae bacterium]|nr:HAD family phosphatase [Schleiferiaceae bacterium]MDR9441897.1 HAD family phosphatase [Schleiferiaceae bacterium]